MKIKFLLSISLLINIIYTADGQIKVFSDVFMSNFHPSTETYSDQTYLDMRLMFVYREDSRTSQIRFLGDDVDDINSELERLILVDSVAAEVDPGYWYQYKIVNDDLDYLTVITYPKIEFVVYNNSNWIDIYLNYFDDQKFFFIHATD